MGLDENLMAMKLCHQLPEVVYDKVLMVDAY
jgi:hypothetical protein